MRLGALSGCHQMASRSFFLRGYQFPLCARCTGVFLGQLTAAVTACFLSPSPWLALLLLPMAVDGLTQTAGWRVSNNALRLVTGLLGGFGYLSVLIWAVGRILA